MSEHNHRFTDRTRRVIDHAMREALQLGHNYVAPEHLVLGILREGESAGARMLHHYDASLADARQVLIALYSTPATIPVQIDGANLSAEDVERIAEAVARLLRGETK